MKFAITSFFFATALILTSCGNKTEQGNVPFSDTIDTKTITLQTYEFKIFHSIDSSLLEAKKSRRKVLLYFTGHFCIYARVMETTVLTDQNIRSKLSHDYEAYALWVNNDSPVGRQNAAIQVSLFNANTLPFFAILDENGKSVNTLHYTFSPTEFLSFIEQ